jgi:exodeoxyribonuclease V beta subunit
LTVRAPARPEPARLDQLGCALAGRNRIEASAGTGKTRAISALFLRCLLEPSCGRPEPLPVSRILVVTFTEAAAEELKGRIRGEVRRLLTLLRAPASPGGGPDKGDDKILAGLALRFGGKGRGAAVLRLDRALRDFDRAAISTIHGFCAGVLRDRPFESNSAFDVELVTDESDLLARAVDDYLRRAFYPASTAFIAAVRQEVTRETVIGVAARLGRVPGARLLPPPSAQALAEAETSLRASFARASALWVARRQEIVEAIASPDSILSRSMDAYGPANLRRWARELDSLFPAEEPAFFPDAVTWFAAGEMAKEDHHKTKGSVPRHPFFDACEEMAAARRAMVALVKAGVAPFLAAELPRRKADGAVRGYQDLLACVERGVTQGGGDGSSPLAAALRGRWPVALIDEYQDTDPLQFRIFDVAWRGDDAALFLVGDPKQSIYSFRGADLYAYLASGDPDESRHLLGENYRSVPGLVHSVNALFSARPRAFLTEGVDFFPTEPAGGIAPLEEGGVSDPAPLRLWFLPRREVMKDGREKPLTKKEVLPRIQDALADEVVRLLTAGREGRLLITPRGGGEPRGVRPRDIAVLVRENREADKLQAVFADRGVPAVLGSSASVWSSPTAGELFRVLTAVADPGDERKARAALATALLGVDGDGLAAMAGGGGEWERRLAALRRGREQWSARGFAPMAWGLLAGQEVRPRLLAREGGERRLTDLLHMVELLHREAHRRSLGVEGVLKELARNIADPGSGEDGELRLESDDEALRIATFHRSKGLQWPIVFCPFPWGGMKKGGGAWLDYHDEERRAVLDLRDPQERSEAMESWMREQKAESVRLLYVALTRASHRCYATWGAVGGSEDSAMNWLLHGQEKVFTGDAAMRADLAATVARSQGGMAVTDLPEPDPAPPRAPAAGGDESELSAAVLAHPPRADWSVTSFSSMAGSLPAHGPGEGRDPDEAPPGEPDAGSMAGETNATPDGGPDELFACLPPGAQSGIFLHELLEMLDFSDLRSPSCADLARRLLAMHGLPEEWADGVLAGVERVLRAPLREPGGEVFELAELASGDRLCEMGFFLPRAAFSSREWADALRRQGRGLGSFAGRVERLSFTDASGLLNGFIDLVFRRDGRYHLLDWKSNRLPGYGPADLAFAMESNLYLLQAHLYSVALHLHLGRTLPGYDHDRHFGGVHFLFLRGMEAGGGVWSDRPSRALIEDLARFFPAASPEGREG